MYSVQCTLLFSPSTRGQALELSLLLCSTLKKDVNLIGVNTGCKSSHASLIFDLKFSLVDRLVLVRGLSLGSSNPEKNERENTSCCECIIM